MISNMHADRIIKVKMYNLVTTAKGYPPCWIRRGECLDNNEPPLREAIKPQVNHNVIGNSIANITSVDACADECYDNSECR